MGTRNHFRTPLLCLSLALLMSACSGSTKTGCADELWTGEFGVCLPAQWEEVSKEMLAEKQVPEETIAVFRLSEKRSGQKDNLVVSREAVDPKLTAKQYALENIKTVEVTPEYKSIEKKEMTIDGEDTLLHVFTAKPVPDLPARRFYQLSLTKDGKGFSFTASVPFSVTNEIDTQILEVFSSITLKEKDSAKKTTEK